MNYLIRYITAEINRAKLNKPVSKILKAKSIQSIKHRTSSWKKSSGDNTRTSEY
jgi:hypothetical protein